MNINTSYKSIVRLTFSQLILIVLFLSSNTLSAQEVKTTRDIGLWLNVGVNYEFKKDWTAQFNQGFRTFDNAIGVDKSLTELGMTYKINRNFKLGIGGRYAYARKSDLVFTHDIRYDLDIKFKSRFTKKFHFEYRLKFQHKYANLFKYYNDVKQNSNLRNRIKFEYKIGEHSIYFSSELFREFARYKKPEFDNLRFNLGDELKTKLGKLNYSLAYELELNDAHPLHFFFLNIGYTFEFEHE